MKTNRILIAFAMFLAYSLGAQTLQTVKTYHDPYTKTHIEEVYTVIQNTSTKQGNYKRYDKNGFLVEEATFQQNQLHGSYKTYYGADWKPGEKLAGKVSVIENYINGVQNGISEKYNYINGKQLHFYQKTYDKGIAIKEIEYYDDGNKKSVVQVNGLCTGWYNNGQKEAEYNQKNGEIDGQYLSWYENGNLMEKGTYSVGNLIGSYFFYYENGKAQVEKEFNDKYITIKAKEYFENGNLKFERYVIEGSRYKELTYDEATGNKTSETELALVNEETKPELKLDGKKFVFYNSGRKLAEANYIDGIAQGRYVSWFENGNLKEEGNYLDNKENGKWINYYENGNRQEEIVYVKNKITEQSSYHSNGQLNCKKIYVNGEPEYPWTHYKENGTIEYVEQMVDFDDGYGHKRKMYEKKYPNN